MNYLVCDNIFEGNPKRIYCSKKCKNKFFNDKYSDSKKVKIKKKNEIVCIVCGSIFIGHWKRKYCSSTCKNKLFNKKRMSVESNRIKRNIYLVNYRKENPHIKKEYVKNNLTKIRKTRNVWQNENYNNNPMFRVSQICRGRIRDFLKQNTHYKISPTFKMIGCTPQELKQHIEKQFTEGMSWDKMGEIHIDHFVPLASAKTEEEVIKLCHYKNLQPMWAIDNLKKGARY